MEQRRRDDAAGEATIASGGGGAGASGGDAALLRFLVQSAGEINSTLELDEVLWKVARRVQPFVDCHLFTVMLWNSRTRLLEHAFSLRDGERTRFDGGLPLGHGITGMAAAQRQPIRVDDVTKHPTYVTHPEAEKTVRSELAVPLLLQDRLIGVINLEAEEPKAFTREHEQALTALASHVATAVENARLYERLRRDERRYEQDLATARDIQNGLLPRTGPRTPGIEIGTAYLPATGIGGDFFDFLNYGEGRLAVAAADVAGKGTPAALYGSLAVGIMRGQVVERTCEPDEMLERMNEQLGRQSIANRFVAMSFAVFDPPGRRMSIANAGFSRPIRLRDGGSENIDIRGIPLGLFPESRYEVQRFDLRPRDVWVFCSDGLQEAVNGVGEQFGGDDLEDILRSLRDASAQQIAEGVLRASTAYAGGEYEEHPDDRSVVVIKIR